MKKWFVSLIACAVALSFGNSTKAMNDFEENTPTLDIQDAVDYQFYLASNPAVANTSVMAVEKLEGIQLELPSDVIIRGEEQTVKLNGLYEGGLKKIISPYEVEWTSTKPAIATVTDGKVKAIAPGEIVLIASYGGEMDFVTIQIKDFKELPPKTNNSTSKVWKIKFNEQIDIRTVEHITVLDSAGSEVPVRYNYLNDKKESIVEVIPVDDYKLAERYTIWVKDVQSLSGNSLKQFMKMDFTIKK